MLLDAPTAEEPRFHGRVAVAGIAWALAMLGLAAALGDIGGRHGAFQLRGLAFLVFGPVYGAALGKAILRDGHFVYGTLLALTTWLGLWIGLGPDPTLSGSRLCRTQSGSRPARSPDRCSA